MFGLFFRLVFSVGVLVWYSVNVWNMITDYFKSEFHKLITNDTEHEEFSEL